MYNPDIIHMYMLDTLLQILHRSLRIRGVVGGAWISASASFGILPGTFPFSAWNADVTTQPPHTCSQRSSSLIPLLSYWCRACFMPLLSLVAEKRRSHNRYKRTKRRVHQNGRWVQKNILFLIKTQADGNFHFCAQVHRRNVFDIQLTSKFSTPWSIFLYLNVFNVPVFWVECKFHFRF